METLSASAAPPVRVLIVEDDLVDRMACRRAFRAAGAGAFALIEADNGQDGLALALAGQADCVLLDYNLPDLTGLEFLASLAAGLPDDSAPPVMMLTGADSATVAAEAMRRGARDYLVKDADGRYLELLPAGIKRMLREQQLRTEKQQAEVRFRMLVEQIRAITYVAAPGAEGRLQYVSPQIRTLGYTPEQWLADPGLQRACMHPDDREHAWEAVRASRASSSALCIEYRLMARDGSVLWVCDQADLVAGGTAPFIQGILVDITASKEAEQALRQSQEELRRLAAHQERIKEDERKRIAQEIHDELGGVLTGIRAYILVAQERAAAAGRAPEPLLAETADLVQGAIETVRRVITDLRPSVLDQLGVWAALEWYAGQVALRAGLRCECSIDAAAAVLELDPERSTLLFRIVQEALTNVVRHAGATEARVRVACDGPALLLTVADNGKGIAAEGLLSRESWGILGMHERSRSFGGELAIAGGLDGTVLSLRLPLTARDAKEGCDDGS